MKRILITALLCSFFFIGTAQASAGLGMGPSQKPGEPARSWIVHTLLPGEQIQDSLMVSNSADQPVTIMLEALDGVNTLEGAYTLVESTADNKGVGTWIRLSQNEIRIPANSSREINFTITVPNDAPVGEQSGGIVAFIKPDDAEGRINLKLRLGTRVYITVPGKVERDVQIERLTPIIDGRKLTLELFARNESNVNLKPSVEFKLKGLLGSLTQKIDAPGIYLPGAPIQIKYEWPKPLGFLGYYTATALIHTNETTEYAINKDTQTISDQTFTIRQSFWVGLQNALPLLLTLLLLWIIWRTLLYFQEVKRYKIKTEDYLVKKGETLTEVADKTGVLPDTIAKFNCIPLTAPPVPGKNLEIPIGELTPTELAEKSRETPMPTYWKYLLLLK